MSEIELEELVAHWAGIDIDEDDNYEEKLEDYLWDSFGIDLTIFAEIMNKVLKGLEMHVSPLTNKPYLGIANRVGWIIKKEIGTSDFIAEVIHFIAEGEDPDKGFVKPITVNGTRTYDLILVKSECEVSIKKPKS